MNVRKSAKGFTLVEMLVVIAIIAILAAALFPAIQNAMDSAKATALKNKGRGIWVAVTSANMEREPLNLCRIWPKDLVDADEISSITTLNYFNYLLSEGDGTTFPAETELQVASDLTRDSLIASGITPAEAGAAITKDNTAWGIVKEIGENTPADVPFLVTRNVVALTGLKQQKEANTEAKKRISKAFYTDKEPFQQKRCVWVTRGGGTKDARRAYFTYLNFMGLGPDTDEYSIDAPDPGTAVND